MNGSPLTTRPSARRLGSAPLLVIALQCCVQSCSVPAVRKISPEAYAQINRPIDELKSNVADTWKKIELAERVEALDRIAQYSPPAGINMLQATDPEVAQQLDPEVVRSLAFLRTKQITLADTPAVPISLDAAGKRDTLKRENPDLRSSTALREKADRDAMVYHQVKDVRDAGAEVVSDGSPFFSVMPVVAFRGGMHGTSIPAVAANVQPFDFGESNAAKYWNNLGIQAVFGGVLNQSNGSSGTGNAVGAGLWYPIGAAGSLAVGYMLWEDGPDTRSGVYIGLNLGQSTKRVEPPR